MASSLAPPVLPFVMASRLRRTDSSRQRNMQIGTVACIRNPDFGMEQSDKPVFESMPPCGEVDLFSARCTAQQGCLYLVLMQHHGRLQSEMWKQAFSVARCCLREMRLPLTSTTASPGNH